MLTLLVRILRIKVVLAVLAVFFGWQVFIFLRPRPPVYSPDDMEALTAAARQAAERLAPKIGPQARIGVAHLGGDPLDTATTALKTALASRSGWRVEEHSIVQKFLVDVSRAVSQATSIEEVLRAGQKVDLDVIVAGRVLAVASTNGATHAALELTAYDTRKGAVVLRDTILGLLLAAAMTGFELLGGGQWFRFFGALVFCAGYSFWACERIAERERN